MYCKNCGKLITEENFKYCNSFGTQLNNNQNQMISDDNSAFGFGVLGFFIPLVGLILFLVYENRKPKRARYAGKGALIGFITGIVLVIILVILFFIFSALMFGDFMQLMYKYM